jgi:RNA polymerase sigma-70 factor, ECF subfamily
VALEYSRAGIRHAVADGEPPDVPDGRPDTERELMAMEQRNQVRDVLDKMSDKNRKLLSAVFLEERSSDEICREFGVDADYLRVLLFRARNQFRQKLEKQQDQGPRKSP